ncbi:hypothetical protein Y058_15610 [Vibrio mimicus]|nr:hypothetical protein Y058_15610 [Vibrio mimicus]
MTNKVTDNARVKQDSHSTGSERCFNFAISNPLIAPKRSKKKPCLMQWVWYSVRRCKMVTSNFSKRNG